MSYLIFDIETIPNDKLEENQKPQFNESTVKFGNTKDPEKRKVIIEKAQSEFKTGLTKTMSINNNYARILSIGGIIIDEKGNELKRFCYYGQDNDIELIEQFKNDIENNILVGWNSKRFDIPMIWKRSIFNNSKVWSYNEYSELTAKYRNGSIDLMTIWNAPNDFGKLSECCTSLGIESKTGLDGSMIYQAYKDNRKQDIIDYNYEDCEATLEVFKRVYL